MHNKRRTIIITALVVAVGIVLVLILIFSGAGQRLLSGVTVEPPHATVVAVTPTAKLPAPSCVVAGVTYPPLKIQPPTGPGALQTMSPPAACTNIVMVLPTGITFGNYVGPVFRLHNTTGSDLVFAQQVSSGKPYTFKTMYIYIKTSAKLKEPVIARTLSGNTLDIELAEPLPNGAQIQVGFIN